jgi:hypothetical protein
MRRDPIWIVEQEQKYLLTTQATELESFTVDHLCGLRAPNRKATESALVFL